MSDNMNWRWWDGQSLNNLLIIFEDLYTVSFGTFFGKLANFFSSLLWTDQSSKCSFYTLSSYWPAAATDRSSSCLLFTSVVPAQLVFLPWSSKWLFSLPDYFKFTLFHGVNKIQIHEIMKSVTNLGLHFTRLMETLQWVGSCSSSSTSCLLSPGLLQASAPTRSVGRCHHAPLIQQSSISSVSLRWPHGDAVLLMRGSKVQTAPCGWCPETSSAAPVTLSAGRQVRVETFLISLISGPGEQAGEIYRLSVRIKTDQLRHNGELFFILLLLWEKLAVFFQGVSVWWFCIWHIFLC